jgi:KaiC/GvpD/RAD55 family RecA-like ATPase
MSTNRFYAYRKHLRSFSDFVDVAENIYTKVPFGSKDDYYKSIFLYPKDVVVEYTRKKTDYLKLSSEKRKEENKPSLAGITNVITNKLVFDFDNKDDVDSARLSTLELLERLYNHGVDIDKCQIYFSGNKGFSVEIDIKQDLTPEHFKNIVFALAKDISNFDKRIHDPQRVFRIPGTRHQESGLFKVPLSIERLRTLTIPEIRNIASSTDNINTAFNWGFINLPLSIMELAKTPTQSKTKLVESQNLDEIEWDLKPRFLSSCKYALQNGYFKEGGRSNALSALAATYKNQGFSKELTTSLLNGVAEIQAARNGCDRFPEEEILLNVVNPVFSPRWKGGQYSCQTEGWLRDYCATLGTHKCQNDKDLDRGLISINDLTHSFMESTANIQDNVISTGLPLLDKNIKILTSTLTGILGSPGSGKSTFIIELLKHASKKGTPCIFYSLDMAEMVTYAKFAQMATGYNIEKILDIFYKKSPEIKGVMESIKTEFENVQFNFNTGIAIEDIKQDIHFYKEAHGKKPKLIVIDYMECLTSSRRDQFESTTEIAHKLKRLVNTEGVAVLLLLQPNKVSGDPSKPILSYNNIKGPQTISAECRTIISIHREGFSPQTPDDDRFITLNVIKNTFGGLSSNDFSWDGRFGKITQLSPEETLALKQLRADRTNGGEDDF